MTESISNGYRRLFDIHFLHHYWLDDGFTPFDQSTKLEEARRLYEMRDFLSVTPTAATAQTFKGLGCVYKETAFGCLAAMPADVALSEDATLELIVTVLDPAFYNYTALTFRPQQVHELYYQPEDKIYRYKENVPVLSNLTGATRGGTHFLSSEYQTLTPHDQVESMYKAGDGALRQLTSDQPDATEIQLHDQAAAAPVYLHQGDVPDIVLPAQLKNAPTHGILLEEGIPDQVFALIRLSAARNSAASFVDGDGRAKTPGQLFEVHLKNRATVRQYFDKGTGSFNPPETAALPLTYFGNTGSGPKPSQGLVSAEWEGEKITRLVSKIFV